MRKLSRTEMKALSGGINAPNAAFCTDCGDVTINGTVYHHNTMCVTVPAGGSCHEFTGAGGSGISCGAGMVATFSFCP